MMAKYTLLCLLLLLPGLLPLYAQEELKPPVSISDKTKSMTAHTGFFNFYWSETEGKIYLEVDKWNTEFLYVNSLAAGVGSNDIGLDRNQLGENRIVKFVRSGPKVLLIQPNYGYRAVSENADERASVADAFAQSVLWGFKAEAITGDRVLIDLTPFLLNDAHGVAQRLKQRQQGTYKVDANRSMVYLERTRNFPLNSEFEALLTLEGEPAPTARELRSVVPTPELVSVRQHHSFIQLPDNNYQPRMYDPRSGYFPTAYADYATPISQPLVKRFITRHRLEKKNPAAAVSEPVEPIIYYLDRGAPEPIRSALLDGARWWNEAFEAAGYKDAYRVEVLPEGADPMDVRYNVINWVHRSTRGWSYGSSVVDPRTGEIIKGHVLLGSLRVRQDFLIAQGLIEAYERGETPDPRLEQMALARLRQLSAHEVGHTLGIAHNFAASVNDRASVMDYPHPYITINAEGEMDFSQAYDTGIGEWDKRAILYGYQDFPDGMDEKMALRNIVEETARQGLLYISDPDARPSNTANPRAHLWDSGQSPVEELNRLTLVRRKAMLNFSEKNIAEGAPLSTLESVFVPLYLMHRYQVEATAKLLGGQEYTYAVRGSEAAPPVQPVDDAAQRVAFQALLGTLKPEFLEIPDRILQLLPPQAYGYERDRELFNIYTGMTFDPLAAAEAAADQTLSLMLQPDRLARLVEQPAIYGERRLSAYEMLDALSRDLRKQMETATSSYHRALGQVVEKRYMHHLLGLAANKEIQPQVNAAARVQLQHIRNQLTDRLGGVARVSPERAHLQYLQDQLAAFERNPDAFKVPAAPRLPDGAPIGCD